MSVQRCCTHAIVKGKDWEDADRFRTKEDLEAWINIVGFAPLFANEIEGFSVEEHISLRYWQTGDPEHDPWEWCKAIAQGHEIAYGKFFNRKSGFISLKWLPYFVNFRRNGYDYDCAPHVSRQADAEMRLMDIFTETDENGNYLCAQKPLFTADLKKLAALRKDSRENFHSITKELMMRLYLVTAQYCKKRNKKGKEYGEDSAILLPPEAIWGYEMVTSAYAEEPLDSWERIIEQTAKVFPAATEDEIIKTIS